MSINQADTFSIRILLKRFIQNKITYKHLHVRILISIGIDIAINHKEVFINGFVGESKSLKFGYLKIILYQKNSPLNHIENGKFEKIYMLCILLRVTFHF